MSDKRTLGREEEAAADLPHTRFGKGAAWLLAAGFLATVFAVPFLEVFTPRDARGTKSDTDDALQNATQPATQNAPAENATALPGGEAPKTPGESAPSFRLMQAGKSLPEGADFQRLEGHLEDTSAVWRQVRPPVQNALTRYTDAGNSQVVVGHEGWLFYRQDVDYLTGPAFLDKEQWKRRQASGVSGFPDPIFAIQDFAKQLQKRGIQLVVVPAPVKATVYPDKLWPRYGLLQGPPHNPSFEAFKRRLEARNVLVFDPSETLWRARLRRENLQYFPTDTHWTPEGAALCARALADFVREWVALTPRKPSRYTLKAKGRADASDLVRLLGLPDEQTLYPSHFAPATQVRAPGGKIATPRADADVLLLGDSFAGSYAGAGLISHLMAALERPIDAVTVHNGGSWGARRELQKLMQAGDDRLKGKKLVIYEFVARDLSSGNWIPFTMPSPSEVAAASSRRPTPTPAPTATPKATPKAAPTPSSRPSPRAKPSPTAKVATPKPFSTPTPRPTPTLRRTQTPRPTPTPTLRPTPTPTLRPTPTIGLRLRSGLNAR